MPTDRQPQPPIPPAIQELFDLCADGPMESWHIPLDIQSELGCEHPWFSPDASVPMYAALDADPEEGALEMSGAPDIWEALTREGVLTAEEADDYRARYLPIICYDDVPDPPYFNALVVDTAQDRLPIYLIGEATGGQLQARADSLDDFRQTLAEPPPRPLSTPEVTARLVDLCFQERDYAAAREAARVEVSRGDRRGVALRVTAFACLAMGDTDEGVACYRTLHREFAAKDPGLVQAAQHDLEQSSFACRREILTWLGKVEEVTPRDRRWWRSLDLPTRAALIREIRFSDPVDPDDPSDAALMASMNVSSLSFNADDGVPTTLAPLRELPNLRSLVLDGPGFPYSSLANLSGLTGLALNGTRDLSDASFLESLHGLRSLTIRTSLMGDPSALRHLERLLQHGGKLENLDLHMALSDFEFLTFHPNLRILSLCLDPNVTEVAPLAALPRLESLRLREAAALRSLESLSEAQSLGELCIFGSRDPHLCLASLNGLEDKPNLRELSVYSAPRLTDITALTGTTSLKTLTLSDCTALSDTDTLGTLSSLSTLDLSGCANIQDLRFAARLPDLKRLLIPKTGVADLTPLASCSKLKELECWGAQRTPIKGLPEVLKLPSLRSLSADEGDFPRRDQRLLRRKYGHLLMGD